VAPMSELDQVRDELDDLRGRVSALEFDKDANNSIVGRASLTTKAVDRQLAKARSEWREVATDLEAGMNQIISLLTSPDTALPARRPEKTQSASDSPLT
jgi:hypothetical protein